MGMYTELNIGIQLLSDTPPEVIETLKTMAKGEGKTTIKHPLFETERWTWMLEAGSAYFDGPSSCLFQFDEFSGAWALSLRSNIKNYSNEWQKFLDWLGPHIGTKGYIGTYQYEEAELPTLLLAAGGKVKMLEPHQDDDTEAYRITWESE